MMAQFEADLDPETMRPRVRLNFTNGWTASLWIRTGDNPCEAAMASLACWPTGTKGQTELGQTEASADEAAAYLSEVANRRKIDA